MIRLRYGIYKDDRFQRWGIGVETRLLRYAITIGETGNFTRAAERLRIAQPSLSQQIGKLEQRLGVRLFDRGRGRVVPTLDGARFIERAKKIIELNDDLVQEMNERVKGMGHELVIGTTAITGGHVLPPVLQAFNRQYTDVQVRLIEERTEVLESMAERGEVDLAILSLPLRSSRLACHPLLTEPLCLALPRHEEPWMSEAVRQVVHRQETFSPDSFSLSRLSQAPFVLLKEGYGFRSTVLQLTAKHGFQPRVAYETGSIDTAQSLVGYGLGVAVVPKMVMHDGAQAPKYARLDSDPTRTLVFAHSRVRYLRLAARKFLEVYRNRSLVRH